MAAKKMDNSTDALLQERGKRACAIRKMLRFSREDLERRHGLPASTLRNWESARHGGMVESSARRLIPIFQKEGVTCRLEWLLYGIGDPPPGLDMPLTASLTSPKDRFIAQVLELFRQHYPNAMDAIVPDDAMLPLLARGDIVVGVRYLGAEISKALEQLCIVQTNEGEVLVRMVHAGDGAGVYHLSCINSQTSAARPAPNNVKLFSAAPLIFWIRKKELPDNNTP